MDPETSKIVAQWFKQKYDEIDRKMDRLSASCKRGCDWCCYQSIEILNWEEPLILNYISNQLSCTQKSRIKAKLSHWFNYFDLKTSGKKELLADEVFLKFQQQQAIDRFPCIFLHQRECVIYPVRPLCCRMHITQHHPDICKKVSLMDAHPRAQKLRIEVLASIVSNIPTTLTLLNFSAAQLFGFSDSIPRVQKRQLSIL